MNEKTKSEQKSVVVAESAYNAQNAQFGLVIIFWNFGLQFDSIFLKIMLILEGNVVDSELPRVNRYT